MSKSQFMKIAAEHGIGVEYTPGRAKHPRTGEPVPYELNLEAPEGRWFNTSMCESDCSLTAGAQSVAPNWKDACEELRAIAAAGFTEAESEEA
jgi:hypothetical protein